MTQRIERYFTEDEINRTLKIQAVAFARVVKETMAQLGERMSGDTQGSANTLSELADSFIKDVEDPRHMTHE